jgi:hypothetical protein
VSELVFHEKLSRDLLEMNNLDGPAESLAALTKPSEMAIDENGDAVQSEDGFKEPESKNRASIHRRLREILRMKPLAIAPEMRHGWKYCGASVFVNLGSSRDAIPPLLARPSMPASRSCGLRFS